MICFLRLQEADCCALQTWGESYPKPVTPTLHKLLYGWSISVATVAPRVSWAATGKVVLAEQARIHFAEEGTSLCFSTYHLC